MVDFSGVAGPSLLSFRYSDFKVRSDCTKGDDMQGLRSIKKRMSLKLVSGLLAVVAALGMGGYAMNRYYGAAPTYEAVQYSPGCWRIGKLIACVK